MKEIILKLNNGEHYTIPESYYGKSEVWRIWDSLFLFEIPIYGGTPSFVGRYYVKDVDSLISTIERYT